MANQSLETLQVQTMTGKRTISREQARRFYDRMGAKQDTQYFYEKHALDRLLAYGAFEHALAVVELGCGTGRFARSLLQEKLPGEATYWGCDISPTMVELTRRSLMEFGERVRIELISGEPSLPLLTSSCDRFVSNYVFDLLPENEIKGFIAEARRILRTNGLLCLVSITAGETKLSKLLMQLWTKVHRLNPVLAGGCRPIEIRDYLDAGEWAITHVHKAAAYGVTSETIVSRRV